MTNTLSDSFELKRGDELYPQSLMDLEDPPKIIYGRGDPKVLSERSFSVIGARKASPYGLLLSELAGQLAAEAGLVEVSGGAMGCDQAGGWGALNAGGRHVVVLGGAVDKVYPKNAQGLCTRALNTGGAVISLLPWGMDAMQWSFPNRNRVIAALSQALFVAEASMPSGTFSTAEAAAGLGREVLAAPGSIISPESKGTNYLIANGATCVTDVESLQLAISRIYNTLCVQGRAPQGVPGLSAQEEKVMHALTAAPQRVDEIQAMLKTDPISTVKLLGAMEMQGVIERLMDGRYAPTKYALKAQTSFSNKA